MRLAAVGSEAPKFGSMRQTDGVRPPNSAAHSHPHRLPRTPRLWGLNFGVYCDGSPTAWALQ